MVTLTSTPSNSPIIAPTTRKNPVPLSSLARIPMPTIVAAPGALGQGRRSAGAPLSANDFDCAVIPSARGRGNNHVGLILAFGNASAIVTGGAGGFGSTTVRRLAQMGAKVVIADVSDERGEALAREVGAGSLYVPTDCMDEDAIAKAVQGCRRARVAARRRDHPHRPGLARRPRARPDAGRRRRSTSPGQVRTRHQRVSQLRLRRDQPDRRRDGEERAPRLEPARGGHQHRVHRGHRGPTGKGGLFGGEGRHHRHDPDHRRGTSPSTASA